MGALQAQHAPSIARLDDVARRALEEEGERLAELYDPANGRTGSWPSQPSDAA
jgi:hypothetical protein